MSVSTSSILGCRRSKIFHTSCTLVAAEALPPVLAYWPYLAVPPLVVALFAVHQWLGRRASANRFSVCAANAK